MTLRPTAPLGSTDFPEAPPGVRWCRCAKPGARQPTTDLQLAIGAMGAASLHTGMLPTPRGSTLVNSGRAQPALASCCLETCQPAHNRIPTSPRPFSGSGIQHRLRERGGSSSAGLAPRRRPLNHLRLVLWVPRHWLANHLWVVERLCVRPALHGLPLALFYFERRLERAMRRQLAPSSSLTISRRYSLHHIGREFTDATSRIKRCNRHISPDRSCLDRQVAPAS